MRADLLAFPDLHFPWAHEKALAWAVAAVRRYKPRYVVQLGDLYDQYCFSRFARNPNLMTPKQELERAGVLARKLWHDIKRASPSSKCYQLAGNHDARVHKRIADSLPELQGIIKYSGLDFPGVTTVPDDRDYLELPLSNGQTLVVVHGWLGKHGAHMQYFNKSVLCGHLHRPGIVFDPQPKGPPLFELNAGYMADPRAPVFNYGASKRKKWQVGYGLIDGFSTPSFVSYA